MNEPTFVIPIYLSELIVPAACAGVLFAGVMLFLYIYLKTRINLYAAIFLMSILSFLFVANETLVIALGSYMKNLQAGRQVHRLEQIAGAFFIPAVLFFTHTLTQPIIRKERARRVLVYFGLAAAVIITVIAFIVPDWFISQSKPSPNQLYTQSSYGRGLEGPAYMVRDLLLGVVIVYMLFSIIREMVRSKSSSLLLPVVIGLVIAIITAGDDISHSYTNVHFFFPWFYFPRFATGVTIFILLSMAAILRRFIKQALEVEDAYQALNQSEKKFSQIADNINEVFWLVDVSTRQLLYVSPAFSTIWGLKTETLYQSLTPWLESVDPGDREKLQELLFSPRKGDKTNIEYRITDTRNNRRWIRERIFPVLDENGSLQRVARLSEDITDKKQAEEELVFLAYHDQLTGVLNRKSFYERFEELITQAQRYKAENKRALLFIDLDNFKDINDSLGHDAGDELLRKVAEKLKTTVRSSDLIFRLGGDEFTVILSKIEEDTDAAIVARKIIEAFTDPFHIEGRTLYVGMSIGIAIYPKDGDTVELLIKNADTALYEAKKKKNDYQHFTEELQILAFEKMKMSSYLREAVMQNDFYMVYQPQVSCDGIPVGAEALIRWEHEELGAVPPDRFIPLAEETGQIVPLGAWVIKEICSKLKSWNTMGIGLPISVNLSVKQLAEKEIVSYILHTMETYGVETKDLHLEITESFLLENKEDIIRKLRDLADKGVNFSIDDFGTGYSSLSYLKRLPIKTVKIDRTFISGIPSDSSDISLVQSIVSISKNLNLEVVAEGVETEEQLRFLESIGCDYIQGYFFSKPLLENDYLAYVERSRLADANPAK